MNARAVAIILVLLATLAAMPGAGAADPIDVNITRSDGFAPDPTFHHPPASVASIHGNPYGETVLTIGIEHEDGVSDKEDAVREAVKYWEEYATEHVGYPVVYEVDPDAIVPDVEVTFVVTLTVCGFSVNINYVGCADLVERPSHTTPPPVEVDIEVGRADTVDTLIHELGHTLGLDHDEMPPEIE